MTEREPARVPKLDVILPPSADGSSFAVYQAASAPQVDITLPEGADPRDFFIDAANYQLPHAVLTRARSCAQIIRCTPEHAARAAAPTVQIYLYLDGCSEAVCEGRTERFGPGDLVIYDSRRTYAVDTEAFDVCIVMVPHDRVPPIYLSPRVHGLRLPGDQAGTRLLAGALEGLVREVEGLSVSEADHAVLGLLQFGAGVVETQLARRDPERQRWGDPQLDAGMAYIEGRWRDAGLKPAEVAKHLGLSRSSLYRLFAPLGGIEGVIRQRRIDHAMRALLTSAAPSVSVRDVAGRHGFRNETHFVRAFQARFGVTPSQVHARVASGDRAWLEAQAGRAGLASLQAWLAVLT